MKTTIIQACFVYCLVGCATKTLLVNNQIPRRDVRQNIVDAHDGRVIQFGDKFYWFGTRYGATNGFTEANDYVCYSSDDLSTWTFENILLPNKPHGVYYRPHVVYNAKTGKYVLWYNWYPKLWEGQFGVAVSDAPTGPFAIINSNVSVKHNKLGVGDLGVFVDDDNSAYLSYNTINGHKVSVERLDETFTASTFEGSEFIAERCEAGAMFKRNATYYLMTDITCCFCTQGSGARVYTATQPLGPYTFRQNINRYPGEVAPVLTNGNKTENLFESFSLSTSHAIQLLTGGINTFSSITLYQFTGNRKGQCGDVSNPRVHEPIPKATLEIRYLDEGEWRNLPIVENIVMEQSMMNIYKIKFSSITTDQIFIEPFFADSSQLFHISEIEINQGKIPVQAFKVSHVEGKPIIPAQQTHVMQLQTGKNTRFIWMGDLWGSASDSIKGHDYQFWSSPLQFYENGLIHPLRWTNRWKVKIKR